MQKTSLYSAHQALGAKFIDFAGWAMPLCYRTQSEEHLRVRESVGVFDVSHMGIIDITGEGATDFLAAVLANNVQKLSPGKALYTCMLNERGGILDDLIVYYIASDHYRLVVNAARRESDWTWLLAQARPYAVTLTERLDLALIALQGREARKVLKEVMPAEAALIGTLKPFSVANAGEYLLATTGYTGEDGFEIMLPESESIDFWNALLANDVMPIGLGARDSLRLEAGLNLYGLDMDETVTPLESNLDWTVALEPADRDFIGRKALMAQKAHGLQQNLKAVKLETKGMLRAGQSIFNNAANRKGDPMDDYIGKITSASYSPVLKQSIGFARISVNVPLECCVEIRGALYPITCVNPPLWRRSYKIAYDTQLA